MSPRILLESCPLSDLPLATREWLGKTIHALWLSRYPVRQWIAETVEPRTRQTHATWACEKQLIPKPHRLSRNSAHCARPSQVFRASARRWPGWSSCFPPRYSFHRVLAFGACEKQAVVCHTSSKRDGRSFATGRRLLRSVIGSSAISPEHLETVERSNPSR